MLRWIAGIILILGGIIWEILAWFAASMADRQIDMLHDLIIPCAWGLAPIALGIAICFWR